ncbi:FMN-binding protein [Beggiatoa alba]|nr:FMN-binding protein [Beggiatoa alba]
MAITTDTEARGVYQTPRAFVSEVFAGDPPKPKVLWITKKLRPAVREIMGHNLNRLRLRYWQRDDRSAWVLEEIGKESPITVGLVVRRGSENSNSRLESIRVLEYRESRGDEVRHAFFRDQFTGATLTAERQLDRPIDGISGATLSVRALTKLARLALFLSQEIDESP